MRVGQKSRGHGSESSVRKGSANPLIRAGHRMLWDGTLKDIEDALVVGPSDGDDNESGHA